MNANSLFMRTNYGAEFVQRHGTLIEDAITLGGIVGVSSSQKGENNQMSKA